MSAETLVTLILAIFGAGAHWGQIRAHLKSLEKRLDRFEKRLESAIMAFEKGALHASSQHPEGLDPGRRDK